MAEEDEADDDVGGDDVQVAEELGQHPSNVAEGTLQRTSTISRWETGELDILVIKYSNYTYLRQYLYSEGINLTSNLPS